MFLEPRLSPEHDSRCFRIRVPDVSLPLESWESGESNISGRINVRSEETTAVRLGEDSKHIRARDASEKVGRAEGS